MLLNIHIIFLWILYYQPHEQELYQLPAKTQIRVQGDERVPSPIKPSTDSGCIHARDWQSLPTVNIVYTYYYYYLLLGILYNNRTNWIVILFIAAHYCTCNMNNMHVAIGICISSIPHTYNNICITSTTHCCSLYSCTRTGSLPQSVLYYCIVARDSIADVCGVSKVLVSFSLNAAAFEEHIYGRKTRHGA